MRTKAANKVGKLETHSVSSPYFRSTRSSRAYQSYRRSCKESVRNAPTAQLTSHSLRSLPSSPRWRRTSSWRPPISIGPLAREASLCARLPTA